MYVEGGQCSGPVIYYQHLRFRVSDTSNANWTMICSTLFQVRAWGGSPRRSGARGFLCSEAFSLKLRTVVHMFPKTDRIQKLMETRPDITGATALPPAAEANRRKTYGLGWVFRV